MLHISTKSTSDTTSNKKVKRRPSFLSISKSNLTFGANDGSTTTIDSAASFACSTTTTGLLSPRAPKSITKSRRPSVTADHHSGTTQQGFVAHHHQNELRSKSRRNSVVHVSQQLGAVPTSPTAVLSEKLETFNFKHNSNSKNKYSHHCSSIKEYVGNADNRSMRSSSSKSSSESAGTDTFIINPLAIQAIDSLNGHHKNRSTRSTKKLDPFFVKHIQPSTKEVLCLQDLRKRGLRVILDSKAPLCFFLYHSLEEYSSENLFFYLELRQYELFTYASLGQQLATAKHIFETYLTNNSFFEVNLDDDIRFTAIGMIEGQEPAHCFDAAKSAILDLLESSYMRFQNTDTFRDMVHYCCCGHRTSVLASSSSSLSSSSASSTSSSRCRNNHHHHHHNSENKAIKVALKKLKSYIEFEHRRIFTDEAVLSSSTVRKTMLRRHELLSSMIAEFCKSFLGVEFSIK